MKKEETLLPDGTRRITVEMTPLELETFQTAGWGKTKYCVRCKLDPNHPIEIEAYGDIDANIQAAAACKLRTGDPSFSMEAKACPSD